MARRRAVAKSGEQFLSFIAVYFDFSRISQGPNPQTGDTQHTTGCSCRKIKVLNELAAWIVIKWRIQNESGRNDLTFNDFVQLSPLVKIEVIPSPNIANHEKNVYFFISLHLMSITKWMNRQSHTTVQYSAWPIRNTLQANSFLSLVLLERPCWCRLQKRLVGQHFYRHFYRLLLVLPNR